MGQAKGSQEKIRSYLLRLWRIPGEQGPVLWAALKSSPVGEWVGFRNLDAPVAALRAEMEEGARPPGVGRGLRGREERLALVPTAVYHFTTSAHCPAI